MFKKGCVLVFVLFVTGALLGLLVSAVITYQTPKKYESETIVEVRARPSGDPGDPAAPGNQISPQFFATEFEIMKSHKLLGKVVESLSLATRWNVDGEAAIQMLKSAVTIRNIHGTDLVSIRVRHPNPADARDLAEAVVKEYRDARDALERGRSEEALKEMNKIVRDQEDAVEERRKILAVVMRTKGMNDPAQGTVESVPDGGDSNAAELREKAIQRGIDAQDLVDARREYETSQKLLEQLKLKRVSMDLQARLPFDSVLIHEEPMLAQAPVSPNVTLNLVLGTVAGFILFPIAGLLVMGVVWLVRGTPK